MVKAIMVKIVRITTNGITNFSHLLYPTFTMAKDAKIKPVGLIKANNPIPY